jgi:hypothetical protein
VFRGASGLFIGLAVVVVTYLARSQPWTSRLSTGTAESRLSGVPLGFRNSRIDYVIASRRAGLWTGLLGEEVTANVATVHAELVGTSKQDRDAFRRDFSDQLPVTIDVKVVPDND